MLGASMDSMVSILNCNICGKSVGMLMCGESQVEKSFSSLDCLMVGESRGD